MSLNGLNPRQQEAVVRTDGALLVVAGAGTGKTRVITLRIAQMIQSGVAPEGIVALSFTNKAAQEMSERLEALVGAKSARKVLLSTFHSFALGLLREFPEQSGLKLGFSIVSDSDSFQLLRESMADSAVLDFFDVSYVKERIASLKDQGLTPDEVKRSRGFVDAMMIGQVYDSYTRRLRLYNLVDFDDLVFLSSRLLISCPEVLDKIRTRVSHILVDEYQDTSRGQLEFLRRLVSEKGNICAVGDDDQSIYGWRGADPTVLHLFLETFEKATRITLDQNYRCSPVILEAANAVIRANEGRLHKDLWSTRSDSEPIRVYEAQSEEEEAAGVAQSIRTLVDSGVPPSEIAVLYRSTSLRKPVSEALKVVGLECVQSRRSGFMERSEVQDVYSLLCAAQNPNDKRMVFRALDVLGHPLNLEQQESFVSTALGDLPGGKEFASFAELLHQCLSASELEECLRTWFSQSPYRRRLRASSAGMARALQKEDLVSRFLTLIGQSQFRPESKVLDTVCSRFALGEFDEEKGHELGKVVLLTVHSSKGLEFDHVFVVGLEEGVLPHERSVQSGTEPEERRLMYVAMTRARKTLSLSYARQRRSEQRARRKSLMETQASRYLSDIPRHLCKENESCVESAKSRRAEAARRLFEMFR